MLPYRERITRAHFPKERGRSMPFSFGTLRAYGGGPFRASVVISKKTIRRSVDRHKAKRRIYSALVGAASSGTVGSYVFYANTNALSEKFASMKQVLQSAVRAAASRM